MNNLTVFQNDQFGQIRTTLIDNEPWFVAADICRGLGLENNRMATDRLDDDEKGVSSIDTPGGAQDMIVVNEPGLYKLIIRSDKPAAKPFLRWVTHDVLPAIRKQGYYMTPDKAVELLLNPDNLMKMARALKQLELNKYTFLEDVVARHHAGPDSEKLTIDLPPNTLLSLRDTAKMLDVKWDSLKMHLQFNHNMYPRNRQMLPRGDYDHSLFVIREICDEHGNPSDVQMFTTRKGREQLRLELHGVAEPQVLPK